MKTLKTKALRLFTTAHTLEDELSVHDLGEDIEETLRLQMGSSRKQGSIDENRVCDTPITFSVRSVSPRIRKDRSYSIPEENQLTIDDEEDVYFDDIAIEDGEDFVIDGLEEIETKEDEKHDEGDEASMLFSSTVGTGSVSVREVVTAYVSTIPDAENLVSDFDETFSDRQSRDDDSESVVNLADFLARNSSPEEILKRSRITITEKETYLQSVFRRSFSNVANEYAARLFAESDEMPSNDDADSLRIRTIIKLYKQLVDEEKEACTCRKDMRYCYWFVFKSLRLYGIHDVLINICFSKNEDLRGLAFELAFILDDVMNRNVKCEGLKVPSKAKFLNTLPISTFIMNELRKDDILISERLVISMFKVMCKLDHLGSMDWMNGHDIVYVSIFEFLTDIIRKCPYDLQKRAVKSLSLLIVSNPDNTEKILATVDWPNWALPILRSVHPSGYDLELELFNAGSFGDKEALKKSIQDSEIAFKLQITGISGLLTNAACFVNKSVFKKILKATMSNIEENRVGKGVEIRRLILFSVFHQLSRLSVQDIPLSERMYLHENQFHLIDYSIKFVFFPHEAGLALFVGPKNKLPDHVLIKSIKLYIDTRLSKQFFKVVYNDKKGEKIEEELRKVLKVVNRANMYVELCLTPNNDDNGHELVFKYAAILSMYLSHDRGARKLLSFSSRNARGSNYSDRMIQFYTDFQEALKTGHDLSEGHRSVSLYNEASRRILNRKNEQM